MGEEIIFDIAYLGHVEMFTPKLEESKNFFVDILGMEIVKKTQSSFFLRGWSDYEQYSLKLTYSDEAGIGHTALRAMSRQGLEKRVKAIQQSGHGIGWIDGDFGHGPAYQFYGSDGHLMELYYEFEKYIPPEHLRPLLKNQPQKYTARGVAVGGLDHVNYLSSNVEEDGAFMEEVLGLRLTEEICLDNGYHPGMWYRINTKSYDLVYTHDELGAKGRLHHLAFRVETNHDIWRAADIFNDFGVYIEFAPSKHAINQTYFVYCYEPGGNRIEICSGGYSVFAPDWEPITWSEQERKRGQAWGNHTVSSFHTYGTPVIHSKEDK